MFCGELNTQWYIALNNTKTFLGSTSLPLSLGMLWISCERKLLLERSALNLISGTNCLLFADRRLERRGFRQCELYCRQHIATGIEESCATSAKSIRPVLCCTCCGYFLPPQLQLMSSTVYSFYWKGANQRPPSKLRLRDVDARTLVSLL